MTGDVVTWGAAIAAVGSMLSLIGFWTRYSDRITKAEGRAAAAEKEAAEAVSSAAECKEQIHALGAKLYQTEIWARDEFVRKQSFEGVVARMERGFGELKQEISTRLDRMTDRIEHLGSHPDR